MAFVDRVTLNNLRQTIHFAFCSISFFQLSSRIMGIADVARIHMFVMGFLASGLLVSIWWFEKAWNDVQRARGSAPAPVGRVDKELEKTD
jgi:hypothetical protein